MSSRCSCGCKPSVSPTLPVRAIDGSERRRSVVPGPVLDVDSATHDLDQAAHLTVVSLMSSMASGTPVVDAAFLVVTAKTPMLLL